MRFRLWFWWLKVKLAWYGVREAVVMGFWLAAGDLLWVFPEWRERYYAYREGAWKGAQSAMSFAWWLRSGGYKND